MSGLLFSVGAVSTTATLAGVVARRAGFEYLDDITADAVFAELIKTDPQFRTKKSYFELQELWTSMNKYNNLNNYNEIQLKYAAAITSYFALFGALAFIFKHLFDHNISQCTPTDLDVDKIWRLYMALAGFSMGALAGACFSLGARMDFEYNKKNVSLRSRAILPL